MTSLAGGVTGSSDDLLLSTFTSELFNAMVASPLLPFAINLLLTIDPLHPFNEIVLFPVEVMLLFSIVTFELSA